MCLCLIQKPVLCGLCHRLISTSSPLGREVFVSQGTHVRVWRHFCLSQLGERVTGTEGGQGCRQGPRRSHDGLHDLALSAAKRQLGHGAGALTFLESHGF